MLAIQLYHGRNTVDEKMKGMGFEGPTIPIERMAQVYNSHIRISQHHEWYLMGWDENDLIEFNGKYYGEFSVFDFKGNIEDPNIITDVSKFLPPL